MEAGRKIGGNFPETAYAKGPVLNERTFYIGEGNFLQCAFWNIRFQFPYSPLALTRWPLIDRVNLMFSKIPRLCMKLVLTFMCFQLVGGHLACLQMIAWSRMLATYSQEFPLQQAMKQTFDGKHPCEMCLKIQKTKESEKNQDSIQTDLKRDYFCQSQNVYLSIPTNPFAWLKFEDPRMDSIPSGPPSPPPKRV